MTEDRRPKTDDGRPKVDDLLLVLGVALIVGGTFWLSVPVGMIVSGGLCLAVSVLRWMRRTT